MSGRRAKRERSEIRNRGRLRFLLAIMTLEDLKRLEVVPAEYEEKPTMTAIERLLDERLKRFQKADARFRKKPVQPESPVASVYKAILSGKHSVGFIVDELHDITAGE